MKFFVLLLAVLIAFASQSLAQMTPEEGARRMAEMNQHPSTRLAVANVPASQPSVKPVLQLKAGAPKDVADFYEAFPVYRDGRIHGLEGGIKSAKKSIAAYANLKDAGQRSGGIRDIKKQIAGMNASIDGLKNGSIIFAPDLGAVPLKEGTFVSVTCKAVILQVIDNKNFILQYVDHQGPQPLIADPHLNATLWLSGVDTTGFVDDADFDVKPDQVFRIRGTKTYMTVDGASKTIFAAVAVDYKPYITVDATK